MCQRKRGRFKALAAPGAAALHVGAMCPCAREVHVRLFLDLAEAADAARLAEIRRELSAWLAPARAAELVLPGAGGFSLLDVVPTASGYWDSLFREDGSCTVTFTAYDPRVWGPEVAVESGEDGRAVAIAREGTAPVAPWISFLADAGAGCTVSLAGGGSVRLDREMADGDFVIVDCASERVTLAGLGIDEFVAVGSDFFDLPAGASEVSVEGGRRLSVVYREAWL